MIGGFKTTSRYLLAGASVIGILALTTPEASAQNLQEIQAQIDSMQATIKALQKQVQDAKSEAAAATTAAADAKGSDLDLKVKWKGAPELSSGDGKFKIKLRGRVDVDYNQANQDTRITTFHDVSGTELRRARLGVEGIIYYDWKYILEVDFANDAVRVRDAYLEYQGFKIADESLLFRIGNFKTFNTFQEETSSNYLDTMERAAFISAFDIDRQIGFGTMYYADHFGLAAGIFGQRFPSTQDNPLFAGFTGDEDLTFGARAYVAPIRRETNGVPQVLHFGGSVRTRTAGDDQAYFAYGNETGNTTRAAELRLTNAPDVTGRIGEEDTFWGLEAAALWGPFALQGEYARLNVDLPGGTFIRNNSTSSTPGTPLALNPFVGVPDPEFTGWYVEGSWFFGGHKTYEDGGRWGRPKVNNPMFHGSGGWGALQVVGKYDVLDMGDVGTVVPAGFQGGSTLNFVGACQLTTLYPGVSTQNPTLTAANAPAGRVAECGEMKTWVVGVNWWMTEYMRLMFQYSQSDLSGYPTTPGDIPVDVGTNLLTPKKGFDNATIQGFGMRMHVDW
jgi:phosphate-selective porin OprO and OprP